MEINWLGHSCFRLKGKKFLIITDPFEGLQTGSLLADIVTVSHDHPGHSFVTAVKDEPKIIPGPGEYEIKGIFIYGLRTFHDGVKGKSRGKNTAFLIETEGIKVCHLGDLGHGLSSEQVEELSDTDVLLVPVGGGSTIGAAEAAQIVNLIDPKLVIPMHFRTEKNKSNLAPLDKFLQEMGLRNISPVPELTVTEKNLPPETQVVVLSPGHLDESR